MPTMQVEPTRILPPATHCLIRYLEIWHVNEQQPDQLILFEANVIDGDRSRSVDAVIKAVKLGEAVAGSAWQQKSVVIWQGQSLTLDQIQQQAGVELQTLIAIPVFNETELANVVVLGIEEGNGAVEIWSRDDRDELSISGSYYRGLKSFEYMSQYIRFPKGAGLPGHCWKANEAKMVLDPAGNADFVRSFEQDEASLTHCLGIPIGREYGFPSSILLLLSADEVPFARRFDILKVDNVTSADGTTESCRVIDWQSSGSLDEKCSRFFSTVATQVAESKRVTFKTQFSTELPTGFHAALILPVFTGGQVGELVAFLF